MGCLKKIFKSILFALAIVGFLSIGGKDWLIEVFDKYLHTTHETTMQKAQKVGDFSQINEEFELEKATGMLGYNGVIAEHKATGQKMIVVDANNKPLLTRDDIISGEIEPKLKSSLGKLKYQAIGVDNLTITKHGELSSFGHTVPYVKFKAKISRFPVGEVGGIIAVAQNKKGEDRILVSANENSKYSQLLAEEFFKKIK